MCSCSRCKHVASTCKPSVPATSPGDLMVLSFSKVCRVYSLMYSVLPSVQQLCFGGKLDFCVWRQQVAATQGVPQHFVQPLQLHCDILVKLCQVTKIQWFCCLSLSSCLLSQRTAFSLSCLVRFAATSILLALPSQIWCTTVTSIHKCKTDVGASPACTAGPHLQEAFPLSGRASGLSLAYASHGSVCIVPGDCCFLPACTKLWAVSKTSTCNSRLLVTSSSEC